MEHCIVYFSSSVDSLDENDLAAILEQSRQNNSKLGITGVMLYVRGSIVQVLEGAKLAVDTLFERIQHDNRHKDVMAVLNRPIAQRQFGNWSMGYETLTTRQLEELKAVVDLDNPEGMGSQANDPILLRLIKVFYDSNRYN
jgi:hypothetical protein